MLILFLKSIQKTNSGLNYTKIVLNTTNSYIIHKIYNIVLNVKNTVNKKKGKKFFKICVNIYAHKFLNNLLFKKHQLFGYFNRFIVDFVSFFFKRRVLFFLKKKYKLKRKLYFLKIFKKIKIPFGIKILKSELLYIIYYGLLLKDCSFFLNYTRRIFENNRLKSHKRLFFLYKKIFKKFIKLFRRLGVRGLFFDLHGKIGLTGNAKKKRLYFRCRRHSFTKKWVKINFYSSIIRTVTGVLGISAYIFF